MENSPTPQNQEQSPTAPEPEVLRPRIDDTDTPANPNPQPPVGPTPEASKKQRRRSYRPSHRATFIGLGVVVAILAINAAIIGFVIRKQAKDEDLFNKGQVSISTDDLNKLGINRSIIGDSGVELVVSPDAQFKGTLSVAGKSTFSGEVGFNSKLTGTNAAFTQLQAGETSLGKLNVNGDTTISNLNLRKNLVVAGLAHLQGPATLSGVVAINNSLTVTGNVSIGGKLSVSTFSVQRLTSGGSAPSVSKGSSIGSNGTVSISGNDASGTVAVNTGTGGGNGTLVNIDFHSQYSSAPRVVISPIGIGGNFYLTNISVDGFSIGVTGSFSAQSVRFNYIIIQ